jgi:hypothetical protein
VPIADLEHLQIVTERIAGVLPASMYRRRIALQTLLMEIVLNNYQQLRTRLGLGPVITEGTLVQAAEAIAEDGRTSNPRLIGWSCLYHLYLRDDLRLTQEQFSGYAVAEPRTVRRYQQYVLTEFVLEVTSLEQAAHQRHERARLYDALPPLVSTELIGRDEAMTQLDHVIAASQPKQVQIVGPTGVGKTAFVQHVIRDAIERSELRHLVWLDRPASIIDVYEAINQLKHLAGSCSLETYLHAHPVTVVIDQVAALQGSLGTLDRLLAELDGATVLLLAEQYQPLSHARGRVILAPLTRSDATRLIERELHLHYPETRFEPEEVSEIWEQVGGNPARIRAFIQDLHRVFS